MHDKNGLELKAGDIVLIPMNVKAVQPGDEFCNCTLESLYGRRPDGLKETLTSVNTGVLIRANDDDEIDLDFSDAAAPGTAD